MIDKTSVEALIEYAAGQTQWKQLPTGNDYSLGVEPEDRAPAEWWNALFGIITKNIGNSSTDFTSVVAEINNVLTAAGIEPDSLETNQLISAVEKIVDDGDTAVLNAAAVDATNKADEAEAAAKEDTTNKIRSVLTDASTLTPSYNTSVRLIGTTATRTLSNGVFTGQEFTIFNISGVTITITGTGGSFALTSARNYTKLVWDGNKWLRGVEIPVGATVWLDSATSPITEFGGTWSVIGATGEYLAINTSGGGGTATENLPNITGQIQHNRVGQQPVSGAFSLNGTSIAGCEGTDFDGNIINFSAALSNPKYTTTNTVRPKTRYVKGWKKTAY